MTEPCRFGACREQATWSAIVRSDAMVDGSRHEVAVTYCDKHLQYQKERLDVTPGVSLSDIERLPECSCDMTEEGQWHCPVHGEDAPDPDPDAETGRPLPECCQLICDQPAEFEVTVRYFGVVRERTALYMTRSRPSTSWR